MDDFPDNIDLLDKLILEGYIADLVCQIKLEELNMINDALEGRLDQSPKPSEVLGWE